MAAEALALEPLAWEEEEDEGQRPALALVPERLVAEGSSAAVVLAHIEQEHLRGRLPVNEQPVSPGYHEDGMRRVWIYGLVDPRDDRIRYAGKSHQPRARLGQYRTCKEQGELHPWLLELRAAGLEPQMYLLEETDEQNFKECEQLWMARCGAADLEGNLNRSKGGERGGATLIWTDAAVREAIEEWLAGHDGVFPTSTALIEAGHSGLNRAIIKSGGHAYWRREFGLEPLQQRRDAASIRDAIQTWMSEHDGVFPTSGALVKAGCSGLNRAIARSGGYAYWRSEFGLGPLRQSWDPASIRDAIQTWISEHDGVFPTQRALAKAGYSGLNDAMIKSEGYAYWRSEFGLGPLRQSWDPASIRAAIQKWMSEHDGAFPTHRTLLEAGSSGLGNAINKSGGYAHWRKNFGLEPLQQSWDEASIRDAIQTWMSEHNGVFPTSGALVKAGRSDLDSAIRRSGGYRHWKARLNCA